MNQPPEEPAGPAHGLHTHENWWELIRALLRTYPRGLVPIMVAVGLPMAPPALLALPWELWLASDSVVLDGVRESFVDPITPWTLAGAGVLLLLTLAISPVAVGSGVLIAATALLGRRILVRDAWRQALRRYWTGLTWVLASATVLVAAAATALWALSAEWPPPLVGVLLVAVLVVVWPPLMVTLPVALVEGRNPWRAFGRAWTLGRHRRWLHLGMVAAAFGLLYLSGTGLEHALTAWIPWAEGAPEITGAQALVSLLVTPMVFLLLSAPVAHHGQFFPLDGESAVPTPVYMDLDRVDAHIPAARPTGVRARAVTVVVVAAALVVPPLVAPVVVAADPFDAPELTAEPLEADSLDGERVEMWVEDDRAVVSFTGREAKQLVCDPECRLVEEQWGHYGFGPLRPLGDAYVYPQWQEHLHEDEDDENDQYAPHEDSGLYLHVCEEPGDCEPGAQVRPFADSQHDVDAVAAPVGEELVVVSHVRSYGYDEEDIPFAEEGDTAGLRAHVCTDLACEEPVALDLPEELSTNAFLANGHHLDLEPVGEGGFLLLVTDAAFGSVHALHCSDTTCADMEVTELSGDRFDHEYEGDLRTLVGARALERADGTAAVMLREAGPGTVRVLDCQDAACAAYTEETVTGPGWARPVPGFDLDSEERPQLLTPDLENERMLLVSCQDQGCAETVQTPLVGYESVPRLSGLALDEHDRPHIVWGDGESRSTGGHDVEGQYLRCEDAWCGAELGLDSEVDGEQAG